MTVPTPTFADTGFQSPAESDILAGVTGDINAAFGGGLNPALNTPQGQLASSIAAIVGNVNDEFARLANDVDPAFSSGRYQDGIARIYFIERNPALPTSVQAQCIGAQGVTIPVGASARAADGNLFIATQSGTFDATGVLTLPFACTVPGPIACPAGTLTTIYTSVSGWDAITNPSDGVPGKLVESRAAFEERRRLSVAKNSVGSLPSVLGAVLAVPNVIDAFATENEMSMPKIVGGVTLAPNTLYVAVAGGNPDAIAQAIWSKKIPGCGYNGNTEVVVYDTSEGYVPPYPAYTVAYQVAAGLPIYFTVQLAANRARPGNASALVQAAIVSAFAGLDDGPRAKIGTMLYASRFYAPIVALGSWAQIVSIKVGARSVPDVTFVGSISGVTLTVTSVSSGALAVGQIISDDAAQIAEGTTILAMVTGSGDVGTYTISQSQTVAPAVIVGATASAFDVAVRLDQIPTISPSDIAVSFV